jgi:hypothetical protein
LRKGCGDVTNFQRSFSRPLSGFVRRICARGSAYSNERQAMSEFPRGEK